MSNIKQFAGRYTVGDLIGAGGMADVFIGTDERLNRKVAIKVLKTQFSDDPVFQARFRREAQSAAGLTNPNIVGVYDSGEETTTDENGKEVNTSYIIMEYVDGKTLREILLSEGSLSVEDAVEITQHLLSALAYSHKHGIIHRDVKPGNVMITTTGDVKVMDFGIARAATDLANTMTQSQGVVGTAQYLSPEQARGERVDSRSDLYSAGCLFFELLTGRPPFVGDSPVSIAYQHVREMPPVASTLKPGLPPVYDIIFGKALAKDVNNRYNDATAFSNDLAAALKGLPVSDSVDPDLTQVLIPVDDGDATTLMSPISAGFDEDKSIGSEIADEIIKRKKLLIIIGSIVAGIILLAVIIMLLVGVFSSTDTEKVKVPTITKSMKVDQACQALENVGLRCEVVDDNDSTEDQGKITGQDPASGTEVEKGTTVKLKVSTGPASSKVPDKIAGQSFADVKKLLEDAGFTVSTKEEKDAPKIDCVNPAGLSDADDIALNDQACQFDADKVAGTKPLSGATAKKGTVVKIYMASGIVTIPKLIGQTKDAAAKILASMHLKSNDGGEDVRDDMPAGTVSAQDPSGDQKVGTTITLKYAKATDKVTIPSLIGQSQAYAEGQLHGLGLLTTVTMQNTSDASLDGKVANYDPQGAVAKGSTINITVYKYVAPAPAPTPSCYKPDGVTKDPSHTTQATCVGATPPGIWK